MVNGTKRTFGTVLKLQPCSFPLLMVMLWNGMPHEITPANTRQRYGTRFDSYISLNAVHISIEFEIKSCFIHVNKKIMRFKCECRM